jgi:UDP-N-acetylmuramate dehydrogenase
MIVEENVPSSALTTFKVGGISRFVVTAESETDVSAAVDFAAQRMLPLIPLGGGSNVLMPDGVLEAVLLKYLPHGIEIQNEMLTAEAGASWDEVVRTAVEAGLWGIENLSAVPGTMGGAVVQNIGAYGAVLSDTLTSVTAYDTSTKAVVEITREECALGYRTSIFKTERDRYVILSARLALTRIPTPRTKYKDLAQRFTGTVPTLLEIRTAVIDIRATKFPNLAEYGTAGSFFLNPVLSADSARALQKEFPEMPVFVLPEGGIKIPLGWFFEHVLKLKGVQEGKVEAWRAQALVLVAHAGATSSDVKNFSANIILRAQKEIALAIQPEVRIL